MILYQIAFWSAALQNRKFEINYQICVVRGFYNFLIIIKIYEALVIKDAIFIWQKKIKFLLQIIYRFLLFIKG